MLGHVDPGGRALDMRCGGHGVKPGERRKGQEKTPKGPPRGMLAGFASRSLALNIEGVPL